MPVAGLAKLSLPVDDYILPTPPLQNMRTHHYRVRQVLSAVLSAGEELEAQEMLESLAQLASASPLIFRTNVVGAHSPQVQFCLSGPCPLYLAERLQYSLVPFCSIKLWADPA